MYMVEKSGKFVMSYSSYYVVVRPVFLCILWS